MRQERDGAERVARSRARGKEHSGLAPCLYPCCVFPSADLALIGPSEYICERTALQIPSEPTSTSQETTDPSPSVTCEEERKEEVVR